MVLAGPHLQDMPDIFMRVDGTKWGMAIMRTRYIGNKWTARCLARATAGPFDCKGSFTATGARAWACWVVPARARITCVACGVPDEVVKVRLATVAAVGLGDAVGMGAAELVVPL